MPETTNAASWFSCLPGIHAHTESKPVEVPTGTPRIGQKLVVDRWDAAAKCWREVPLIWDGSAYVEVSK